MRRQPKYAAKRDAVEESIVAALEAAGAIVYRRLPVDLLVRVRGRWEVLEAKEPLASGKPKLDKRQKEQAEFCELHGVPYVTTPEAALAALGLSHTGELP